MTLAIFEPADMLDRIDCHGDLFPPSWTRRSNYRSCSKRLNFHYAFKSV